MANERLRRLAQGILGRVSAMARTGITRLPGLLLLGCSALPAAAQSGTLYHFGQRYDGSSPAGPLVQAADGSYWGTTRSDGPAGYGTVFRLAADGSSTNIVAFGSSTNSYYPAGGLLKAADGNYYGATRQGGATGCGTIFRLTPAGVLSTIYSFTNSASSPISGCYPGDGGLSMDLVQGADGQLYGTTSQGGSSGYGTAFRIKPDGSGFSTMRSFSYGSDGGYPAAGLVFGADGNLYGTTTSGASNYGTVFRIGPTGTGYATLGSFTGTGSSGATPYGSLVAASDGNLYGVTQGGGTNGAGTLFRLSTAGSLGTLYSFDSAASSGSYPVGGLLQASDGKLYGSTTFNSSTGNCGSIFSATTAGAVSLVHAFAPAEGCQPWARPVQGSDGLLYGTTLNSPANTVGGTAFKLTTAGALSRLHVFDHSQADGMAPRAPLLAAADGKLYSTTLYGGKSNAGSVYQLSTSGVLATLFSFDGSYRGCSPGDSGVYRDAAGMLWGSTQNCGISGRGVFYTLDASNNQNLLYAFAGAGDGANPFGTPVPDGNGNLLVVTQSGGANGLGAIVKLTPWGVPSTLYSFSSGTSGGYYPNEGLVQGDDGAYYGTTYQGGDSGYGTVFRITATGGYSTLGSFGASLAGALYPHAELARGPDGYLYGTTYQGGSASVGAVFRIRQNGSGFSIRRSFDCSTSGGCYPESGVAVDRDGSLYGTTSNLSGDPNKGTVWKLSAGGTFTVLRSFSNVQPDGGQLQTTPTLSPIDGDLYGVTQGGGQLGAGTAFRIGLPPVAPQGLAAAAGNASVTLNWTGSPGATSYKVYQGTTAGGEGSTPVATVASTSATISGLSNGSSYFFIVRASDTDGTGPASNEASATPITAPAAPSGLAASAGNAKVTLSWTAAPTATSYKVYQGTSAGGEGPAPVLSGVTGTSVTVSGLTNATAYYFKVAASNAGGDGPPSNEASATPFGPPAAPAGLVATAGPGRVTLSWTAAPQAASYNVYQATSSGAQGNTPVLKNVSGTSVTISGLTNGTSYYFKVSGGNSAGESAKSNEASAVPTGLIAPGSLAAKPGNGKVSLSWTAVDGATSYNVYRGSTAGGESATPIKTGVTTASYSNSGLSNGTRYYYVVRAVAGATLSEASNEASAVPNAIPAVPLNLVATAGNGAIALNWDAVPGATSYRVFRATSPGGEGTTAYKTGIASNSYTVTGLSNGTTWFFTVAASNDSGTSAQSTEASATPGAALRPAAPSGVTATPGSTKATIKWSAVTSATSYNLYRGTTPGGEGPTPVQTGITGTSVSATGLVNGTTYYFQVSAVNGNGEGNRSAEVSATPIAKPAKPSGLVATAGNGAVALSWTGAATATSYSVYQATSSGGQGTTPVLTGITGTSTVVSGLTSGTTYYFTVASVNAGGTSAQSNEASATPSGTAPPLPVLDLVASPGNTVVSLSWSAISGASSYSVYQGTASGGQGATPVLSGLTANGTTISGLANGTTYYFKVVATDAGGASQPSNEAVATPVAPPGAPSGLNAARGYQQVVLNWATVPGASGYNVYLGTSAGAEGPTPVLANVGTASATVTGLTNGTLYFFKVSAINAGGESGTSNEASARPVAVPLAPVALTATPGNGTVALSWQPSANASSYKLYQGTAPGEELPTPAQVGITGTTASVSGLSNGTAYYYTVSAVNGAGESGSSNEASAIPSQFGYNLVYQFGSHNDGANPLAALVRTSDGSLYGTTSGGGRNGHGTVFRIAPDGSRSTLHAFSSDNNDGAYPSGNGLMLASDGLLYGVTQSGGNGSLGVLYALSPSGSGYHVIYRFHGGMDGANPVGTPVQGADGFLYGVTRNGGLYGLGAIYRIALDGSNRVTMKSFAGGADGQSPSIGLIADGSGGYYGATDGGSGNQGVVYRFNPLGWSYSALHAFNGDDGRSPTALVLATDGKLYGVTSSGGAIGVGTAFRVSNSGSFDLLYSFGNSGDAYYPNGLIQGSDGSLYGTSQQGGSGYEGTVFRLSTAGVESLVYSFVNDSTASDDGYYPNAVIQGADGLLYGTAQGSSSAAGGNGTVFKLTTAGIFTRLAALAPGSDGDSPQSPLLLASDGNWYGTTAVGGASGAGTLFRLTPAGVLTTLYSFDSSASAPYYPSGPLVQGSDGLLYGTAPYGGASANGAVYKVKTDGTGFATLISFTGGADGRNPDRGLIRASDGNFYGTASGGAGNYGSVFKLTPAGELTTLKSFAGGTDGYYVNAFTQASDGNLYGTTQYGGSGVSYGGTVFKLTRGGAFTQLYSFTGGTDGCTPVQGLTQGSDGLLYGTTTSCGANGSGEFFSISTTGTFTSLYGFTAGTDGNPNGPQASLLRASDGYFYGIALNGGTSNQGTLFRLTMAGTFTLIHSFGPEPDGVKPYTGLTQASDGSFYGTTTTGGNNNVGTIFKLIPGP